MLVGACLQTLLILILSSERRHISLFLPFGILLVRALLGIAQWTGLVKNPYLKEAFIGRRTALVPDENGSINKRDRPKVAILLLGSKSNHPRGFLYPRFLILSKYLMRMVKQFDSTSEMPQGCMLLLFQYPPKKFNWGRIIIADSYFFLPHSLRCNQLLQERPTRRSGDNLDNLLALDRRPSRIRSEPFAPRSLELVGTDAEREQCPWHLSRDLRS